MPQTCLRARQLGSLLNYTTAVNMAAWGRFKTWVHSEAGPKTTHFWGPVANWGFVLAVSASTKPGVLVHCSWHGLHSNAPLLSYQALMDMNKPPEVISTKMTASKCTFTPRGSLVTHLCLALRSSGRVQLAVHALCMDGAATKLPSARMPCQQ